MYPTNDNHLQCAHSPIAMTMTHFVVWHNDPLPLTNNSISSAKILQITLELLSLVCWALLHWYPQAVAMQFLYKQCYDIHFQIWCILQSSKSNCYVLSGQWTSRCHQKHPEPAQCICKQFGCYKSIETLCKDVPASNICIWIINILLHKIWRPVNHVLLFIETPNLPPSILLLSYYNPPTLR